MRQLIIAGNWKMNTALRQARELVLGMRPGLDAIDGVEKVVCPPFVSLAAVKELLAGSTIALGAQNMHHEDQGAYTGEIAPTMLVDLCRYVIVGHSERRHLLGETDSKVGKKVRAALRHGLIPIMCVGERLEDREDGRAEAVVDQQVSLGVAEIEAAGSLVIAYEPVWAIGTGRAATPDDAQAMAAHIRAVLTRSDSAASETAVLYGGSVNADNVASFMREDDIDGALVGGASLDAAGFVRLTERAAAA